MEAQCVEKATLSAGTLSDYDEQSHIDNLFDNIAWAGKKRKSSWEFEVVSYYSLT